MPSILIVDDEAVFRRGLRSMIASLDPEWDVVGDARNGYEALEMLEKHRPDVVLTDIRMPGMDGLQLQKIAREKFPEQQCVVVSGYEDFTYVQQSMRFGARDYLMKPVEREELSRVLGRLKEELAAPAFQHRRRPARLPEEERRSSAADHLAAGLLRGSLRRQDLDVLKRIGIDLSEPYFNAMILNLDRDSVERERFWRTDPSLFQLYIRQFVQEMIDYRLRGFSFAYADTKVVALVNMADPREGRRRLLETAESIRMQIKALSGFSVTIGVGRPVQGFESLPASFREAEIALMYRLVAGGDKIIDYADAVPEHDVHTGQPKWSWDSLQRTINEGRLEEIGERVAQAVGELCRKAQTPELVHRHICKLIIHYHEVTEEMNATKEWLGEKDIRTLLNEICSISSRGELIEACRDLFGRLAAVFRSGKGALDRDPVALALQYMEKHFRGPITLKEVADKVYLNPTYFSGLFRQRTGQTFIERLVALRVEDAKRLLALTDEKMAVIAEKTGFANLRHFNRVFKSETGLTPKAYREKLRGNRPAPG